MAHYTYWKNQYPKIDMNLGMFGENLTTEGLIEDSVHIGYEFLNGSARLIATQPRIPCYKLGIKFGRMNIIKSFISRLRPGNYFKVLQEGEVGFGDKIKLVHYEKDRGSIKDIVCIYKDDDIKDVETMKRVTKISALPEGVKNLFRRK
ncbi:MAG: MOSC domain-containing protein [Nitrosopumilus sp.]|nr:MOSC domain-containing protein [Nitrosopumilus sp.]